MPTDCCCDKEEKAQECEHEFEKLNETQIFCKFCGEIRGPKSPCVHYDYSFCTCHQWKYIPQWQPWSGWGTTTVTYKNNTTTTPL